MRLARNHLYSLAAAAAFLALLVAGDLWFDSFSLRVWNLCAIYVVLALSLNLVNGFTGLFSLGHAGFMAVGAYTSAKITLAFGGLAGPAQQAVFLVALLCGMAAAALAGLLVGMPSLRLRGDYLAIVTLGFG